MATHDAGPDSPSGLDARAKRIAKYGFFPGLIGLIGMVIASGHGAALNDAP
jgi:hypothetical protein